ncbi:MAG: hypothetical protein AB1611_06665 [bacterium]
MRSKRFLRAWIFSIVLIAGTSLIYSSAFGQFSQDVSISGGNLFSTYSLDSSLFISPFLQTSAYSSTQVNPFSTSTLDSSLYVSPLVQSSSYSSSVTNPFAAASSEYSTYHDLFSTSYDQSSSYQNILGFGYSTGSSFSAGPFSTSAGGYSSFMAPGSSYSSEYDVSQNLFGGSSHYENSLVLPWTTYGSEVTSSYGLDAFPFATEFSGSSVAVGTPTVFSGPLTGFNRTSEGIANLIYYAPISAQLDQVLGDRPMYTAEGMPFYATASYFNPYNASNYYFAPGVKTSTTGITPGGVMGPPAVISTGSYVGVSGPAGVGLGGAGGGTGSPAAGGISAAGFSAVSYGIMP